MEYINFRNVMIPKLGFGTYKMGDGNPNDLKVLEYGYNNFGMTLIDTAEMYGDGRSEILVGEFLKNVDRNKIFLIDKILPSNAKKGNFLKTCKESLKRLGTSYIDLYLLHWREDVILQDMVDEMEKLVSLGLIKHWGVSNFDVNDMEDLFKCKNGEKCFANQCLYNIESRGVEFDLIPYCKKCDVLFISYSPIGHNPKLREQIFQEIDTNKIKERTPESMMLQFVIKEGAVAIFKTSSIEHLVSNMKDVFLPLLDKEKEIIDSSFPKPTKKEELKKI